MDAKESGYCIHGTLLSNTHVQMYRGGGGVFRPFIIVLEVGIGLVSLCVSLCKFPIVLCVYICILIENICEGNQLGFFD